MSERSNRGGLGPRETTAAAVEGGELQTTPGMVKYSKMERRKRATRRTSRRSV